MRQPRQRRIKRPRSAPSPSRTQPPSPRPAQALSVPLRPLAVQQGVSNRDRGKGRSHAHASSTTAYGCIVADALRLSHLREEHPRGRSPSLAQSALRLPSFATAKCLCLQLSAQQRGRVRGRFMKTRLDGKGIEVKSKRPRYSAGVLDGQHIHAKGFLFRNIFN